MSSGRPSISPSPVRRGAGSGKIRLLIALAFAAFALLSYFGKRQTNPVTGETQYVDLSPRQEVALGIQAAPEMAQRHGGLDPDAEAQALLDAVGERLVRSSRALESPYEFEFHLLADRETVNAFALPGGQVFITRALLDRLETEAQLAGVLAHEIGHVVGRHGAEHMAKAKLTQGLTGAAVLGTYDPGNPATTHTAAVAALVGKLVTMKHGRGDEIESDQLAVLFAAEAGYDPEAMVRVMEILAASSPGGRPPEFFSTHPNPERRVERIQEAIAAVFPGGVPDGLDP